MNAEAIAAVSVAVTALTQMLKWGNVVPDRKGPLAVMALAAIGVLLWAVSNEPTASRALIWPYFVGWVMVSTSAAGIFGFVRAVQPEAVTRSTPPPEGVAQQRTGKI